MTQNFWLRTENCIPGVTFSHHSLSNGPVLSTVCRVPSYTRIIFEILLNTLPKLNETIFTYLVSYLKEWHGWNDSYQTKDIRNHKLSAAILSELSSENIFQRKRLGLIEIPSGQLFRKNDKFLKSSQNNCSSSKWNIFLLLMLWK